MIPVGVSAGTINNGKTNYCNCKAFVARYVTPPNYGNAHTWQVNSSDPILGGVVVWKKGSGYSSFGHVGIVIDYDDDNLYVLDANYKRCKLTFRVVSRKQKGIKGYYDPSPNFPIENFMRVITIYGEYETIIRGT